MSINFSLTDSIFINPFQYFCVSFFECMLFLSLQFFACMENPLQKEVYVQFSLGVFSQKFTKQKKPETGSGTKEKDLILADQFNQTSHSYQVPFEFSEGFRLTSYYILLI
jgi:hypothetical protein